MGDPFWSCLISIPRAPLDLLFQNFHLHTYILQLFLLFSEQQHLTTTIHYQPIQHTISSTLPHITTTHHNNNTRCLPSVLPLNSLPALDLLPRALFLLCRNKQLFQMTMMTLAYSPVLLNALTTLSLSSAWIWNDLDLDLVSAIRSFLLDSIYSFNSTYFSEPSIVRLRLLWQDHTHMDSGLFFPRPSLQSWRGWGKRSRTRAWRFYLSIFTFSILRSLQLERGSQMRWRYNPLSLILLASFSPTSTLFSILLPRNFLFSCRPVFHDPRSTGLLRAGVNPPLNLEFSSLDTIRNKTTYSTLSDCINWLWQPCSPLWSLSGHDHWALITS